MYRISKNKLFIENDLLMYNNHGYSLVIAPSEISSEILDTCHVQNPQTCFEKFLVALFILRNNSVCF